MIKKLTLVKTIKISGVAEDEITKIRLRRKINKLEGPVGVTMSLKRQASTPNIIMKVATREIGLEKGEGKRGERLRSPPRRDMKSIKSRKGPEGKRETSPGLNLGREVPIEESLIRNQDLQSPILLLPEPIITT